MRYRTLFRKRSALTSLSPAYVMKHNALYKGVLGGSKSWTVLFVFLHTPKLMRKVFGRDVEYLGTERLKPGQFVRVESLTQLSKAERKAILKAK